MNEEIPLKINFDKRIREMKKRKDSAEVSQVKKDIAYEEEQLKQFFNEQNKPLQEDPTLTRQERFDQKQQAFKDIVKDIQPQRFLTGFMNYKAATPEEEETLLDCKNLIKKNFIKYAIVGLLVTQATNYHYGRILPKSLKAFGVQLIFLNDIFENNLKKIHIFKIFFKKIKHQIQQSQQQKIVVGLFGGGSYGLINSMEYTLRRFESLGPDYYLGRLAIQEIEEFRMDKNLHKDKII